MKNNPNLNIKDREFQPRRLFLVKEKSNEEDPDHLKEERNN